MKVYCEGELLEAVQMARVYEDSKHYVDMPMRHDPEDILEVGDRDGLTFIVTLLAGELTQRLDCVGLCQSSRRMQR